MNDFRFAFRQLRKHPFANAIIVLTIALLIGAVSVIYASLENDRAKYEPFPESDRMVRLWRTSTNRIEHLFPAALFQEYAEKFQALKQLGALEWRPAMTLTEVGEPLSYNVAGVSASLFQVAEIAPVRGRLFDPADEEPGGGRSLLISEQMWREKLGADDNIIGRQLRLNDRIYTVIGVLPEYMRSTRLAFNTDIWQPMRFSRERAGVNLNLFGRLKEGATLAQAQAELAVIAPPIETNYAPDKNERTVYREGFNGARVERLHKQFGNRAGGLPLALILIWVFASTIIGSVVGIACFNVTNLLLARVSARSRDHAIQLSLGAPPWRIVRQLMLETLLLAVLGGLLGLVVSFWIFDFLRLQHVDVRWDWQLYGMVAGCTLVLGLLIGLLPALRSAKTDLTEALKDGGATVGGRRRHRLRNFLISSEVAMAMILCVVAGLLARSYLQLFSEDLGFDPNKFVAVTVDLRRDHYPKPADHHAYADRALGELRQLPGVEAAALSTSWDLIAWAFRGQFTIESTARSEEQNVTCALTYISSGYARLNGRSLLRGRDLSADSTQAQIEALVSEAFVNKHLNQADPVGLQIRLTREDQWQTIVGVIQDRNPLMTHQEIGPEVLMGFRLDNSRGPIIFQVASKGEGKTIGPRLRDALQQLDANQAVQQPVYLADVLKTRAEGPKRAMLFLGSLAAVGLFIALMGVYGVVAFSAQERTQEVGIRMAIGATRRQVTSLMLWQGMRLMLMGAFPGLLVGSLVIYMLPQQGLPPGLLPLDPWTHAAVVLLVGSAGFLASVLPARKAASMDPMKALRYE